MQDTVGRGVAFRAGFLRQQHATKWSKLCGTYVRVFRSIKAQHSIDFHFMETVFGVVLTRAIVFDVNGRDREEEQGLFIPIRLLEVPELCGYRAH
jgi:hypothetical protein